MSEPITAEQHVAACEFVVPPQEGYGTRAEAREYGPGEKALRRLKGYPEDYYIQAICAKCGWWRFLESILPAPTGFTNGIAHCPRCGTKTGYLHQRERRLEPDERDWPREKCEPPLKRVAVARLFLRRSVLPRSAE